ncbi:MAG: flagellar basal body L-ring protein FlgH [Desulfobacterales bacterium]|nr:flagellar basal body L-ring protein FlgH [Desulfobacterales bacterium]MBF0396191.1 flagellar basal body L-ring protein FlgH [Desulfobacterales bacterium]
MLKNVIFILSFLILTSCTANKDMAKFAAKPSSGLAALQANPMQKNLPPDEGSLWTDSGEMLFVDKRARKTGDTVIIDIVENTSSKLNANTSANAASDLNVGVANMPYKANLINMLQSDTTNKNNIFQASNESTFKGQGSSDRSGQVTASIGARVTEVLPNGDLVIQGKREMKVNNESQYISISGIARQRDIDPTNRIKSTFLSDAHIEYFGKGVLAEKQKPGWLTRIVSQVWPF